MEASPTHKIRVLFTSIDAGGGHKELKDSFIRSLKDDPGLEIFEYHSPSKFFDFCYKLMMKYAPVVWHLMFKYESSFLVAGFTRHFAVIPERKHLRKVLREINPDIVITTHFIQATLLAEDKKKTKAKYKIVSCIYDFGGIKGQFHLHTPAEFYVVRDEWTKENSLKYVDASRLFVFGTTVNNIFTVIANLSKEDLYNRFNQFKAKYFKNEISTQKKSILFLGGSGWTRNSLSLIKDFSKINEYNIFVACGKDVSLVETLKKLPNIYPFGFVAQEELAVLEASVNVAVMSSIAPATIYELLTINKYPLFVHRFIYPQEEFHTKLVGEWNIGKYEPDDGKMITLVQDFLQNPQKFSSMTDSERKICEEEVVKVKNNVAMIKELYAR